MKSGNIDRVSFAAFAVTVLPAGLNGIGIRFTVMELPPFWGATLRFAPATLLLFIISFTLRPPLPKGRSLLGALLYGILSVGANFAFIYWGLQKVHAGMAQVILALVPLLTFLFALAHRQEMFRWRALIGSLLAVGGVSLVFSEQIRANVPILYLFAVILGAACFAESNVIIKQFPISHPIPINAVAMTAGSVILFLMSIIFRETPAIPSRTTTWISPAYLILFGSCVVFILNLFVLKRWTASATSYQFVLLPFVTITASALLAQETLSLVLLAGAALVIAGVYISAIGATSGRQPATRSTTQFEEISAPEN